MTRELVLTLHRLGEPPRHIDKDEAKFWVCTEAFGALLDRCRDAKVGNGSATVLTFDDAHLSHATVALPRLVEKGLSGIFFVCAGRIGQKDYLDRAALIDMLAAGMEIGTHGMDHVDWRQLDGLAKVREYDDARACIEDICGRKITKAAAGAGRPENAALSACVHVRPGIRAIQSLVEAPQHT